MTPDGSGSLRRYELVGAGVVLLEEVCHGGSRLCGLIRTQDHVLLPDQLPLLHHVCLHAAVSHNDDNEPNL